MQKLLPAFVITFFVANALAGGKSEMPDFNHMPRGAKNVNQIGVYAEGNAKAYGGKATANGGQGGTGQGGSGGDGYGGQAYGNGNVDMSGSFNYPRQTPMAYAPSSFSANPCVMNYSAGGSGAPFGFSLGISAESDDCNARADSIRWQEMQMAPVACQRMLIDSDENQAALKAAGLNCNDAKAVAVAVPTNQVIPVATPALDAYVPREEFNRKLDNAHRLGAMK